MHNLGCLFPVTRPEKTAIIDQHRSITYGQLDGMANWVANDLALRGYRPGDRIAIRGPNTIDHVVTFFGILRLGAVAVMINDRSPESQIKWAMGDSGAKLLIENPRLEADSRADFEPHPVSASDPAMILYTSGSTAAPKGVILPHRHRWMIEQISRLIKRSERRVLVSAPMCHLNGLSNIEITLCNQATLVLLERFDPRDYIRAIDKHAVTMITSVPSMLARMFQQADLLESTDLSSVSVVHMASEPPSKKVLLDIRRHFPFAHVIHGYGVTEVSPGIFGPHPTKATPITSVGYARPENDYRLIDGILQIKSPSMFLNYTNIDRNNVTDDGYYITNDCFRVDADGFYYFEGRADDMFTCGGHNIYPRQLESVLESHPDVVSAAVVGVWDDIKGSKPYAFVVGGPDESKLRDFLLEHVPVSHCPRRIWHLEHMPLTSLHKIDKAVLRQRAEDLINEQ